jgi:hypothetical protein
MKTNEAMRIALVEEAEAAAQRLLTTLQSVTGGDFKGLEEQVLTAVFELGRTWVESLLRGQTAGTSTSASSRQLRAYPTVGGRTAQASLDTDGKRRHDAPLLCLSA